MKRFFRFAAGRIDCVAAGGVHCQRAPFLRHVQQSVEKVVTGTVVALGVQQSAFLALLQRQEQGRQRNTVELRGVVADTAASTRHSSTPSSPNSKITVQFCPLKDGRPGGGIGWVKLANGNFISPADSGCNGSEEAIEHWKRLAQERLYLEYRSAEREDGNQTAVVTSNRPATTSMSATR